MVLLNILIVSLNYYMEKIYIEIPYDRSNYSDILKETAVSYCNEVNNLIHKSILTKNKKEYERIINNYIKDVNFIKINISNTIIANYIINYTKYHAKLIDDIEFKNISSVAKKLTSSIEIYTDNKSIKDNVLLFLFFDNRLMFNIF